MERVGERERSCREKMKKRREESEEAMGGG